MSSPHHFRLSPAKYINATYSNEHTDAFRASGIVRRKRKKNTGVLQEHSGDKENLAPKILETHDKAKKPSLHAEIKRLEALLEAGREDMDSLTLF